MTEITKYLEDIMTAIYGEEVRGSIHDAIDAIDKNVKEAEKQLQKNIDNEQSARESADQTLQGNIDAEIQNRTSGDSSLDQKITNEASTRESADVALQKAIDTEKAALEVEQTAREKADDALRAAIGTGGAGGGSGAIVGEITIPSSGWTNDESSYYIDVDFDGVLANRIPLITIHPDSMQIAEESGLSSVAEALDGSIRFRAAKTPTQTMTATVALLIPTET